MTFSWDSKFKNITAHPQWLENYKIQISFDPQVEMSDVMMTASYKLSQWILAAAESEQTLTVEWLRIKPTTTTATLHRASEQFICIIITPNVKLITAYETNEWGNNKS